LEKNWSLNSTFDNESVEGIDFDPSADMQSLLN